MLNSAVAVGHVMGASAGLAETERVTEVLGDRQQWHAVRAYLLEMGGEFTAAGDAYAAAAEKPTTRRSEITSSEGQQEPAPSLVSDTRCSV